METIEIAGRKFKGVTGSTMANDVFNQAIISKAGLDKLCMESDETADEFALRIYRHLAVETDVFLMLGGLLMPAEREPEEWTEEMAKDTAALFRRCTNPKDKHEIQGQITGAVIFFLRAGLVSVKRSPRFSEQSLIPQPISLYSNEEDSILESGPDCSAS